MDTDRRNIRRHKFNYYMRVLDNNSFQLTGYLADISAKGFQIDSPSQLIAHKNYNFRLELTPDVSDRSFITFSASCRWSRPDDLDPNTYDSGFQIVSISPHDSEIFQRIVTKYAAPEISW